MKTTLMMVIFAACISGCVSGDNGSECGDDASCPPPKFSPLESILGLWDASSEQNSGTDVIYAYIGNSGEFLTYDLQQDEFGTGENCHIISVGRIWRDSPTSDVHQFVFEDGETEIGRKGIILTSQVNGLIVQFGDLEEIWMPLDGVVREDLIRCENE